MADGRTHDGASLEEDTGGRRRSSRVASLEEPAQGNCVDSAPCSCRFSQERVELDQIFAHSHLCSRDLDDVSCGMNDRKARELRELHRLRMGFCPRLPSAQTSDVGGVTTAHRRFGETVKPRCNLLVRHAISQRQRQRSMPLSPTNRPKGSLRGRRSRILKAVRGFSLESILLWGYMP